MIYRRGLPGVLDRVRDAERKKLLFVAGGVLVVLVLLVFLLRGSGDSPAGSAEPAPVPDAAGLLPGTPGHDPGPSVDEQIADSVSATMGALEPTPTPEPTPDIASTVQARLTEGREVLPPEAVSGLLDGDEARGPFLRGPDRIHMAQLGERLWVAVRVYLRLQEVADLEFSRLSWTFVEDRVALVDGLFGEEEPEPIEPRGNVDPVVGEYAELIFDVIGEIRTAALELRAIQDLFAGAGIEYVVELPPETRELIQEHYFSMDRRLRRFDGVMTEYGCSVCGELFRTRAGFGDS